MVDESEVAGRVRGAWRRGLGIGAAAAVAAVFVGWTLWSLGELRRDVAAMKDWARAGTAPMVSAASRETAADDLAAARVAEALARSGSAGVDGCSTGAYPNGSSTALAPGRPGESVDALEWLRQAGQG